MPAQKTERAATGQPPFADFRPVVCQVLKTCLDQRVFKLPSIPLVKFLYLSECEYFRLYRRRLSTLGWFFHKYGPWARELANDPEMVETEARLITATKCIKYHKLDGLEAKLHGDYIEDLDARAVVRRVVTPWAQRYAEEGARWDLITRELLNEVYFHTAPMRHAQFKETLDFALIPPAQPAVELKIDPKWVAEVKRKFRGAHKKPEPARSLYPLPELTPLVRDSVSRALEQLSEEDGSLGDYVPFKTEDGDLEGALGDE